MITTRADIAAGPVHLVLVGETRSPIAGRLRRIGHRVEELRPADFPGAGEMADVVAVLPDCPEPERIGALAAACARLVWFEARTAPPGLARLLAAAGIPVVESGDLVREARA